jgi:hypothetical protein
MAVEITFFTRRNCRLCDAAMLQMSEALAGQPYALREIDIDQDRTHFDDYNHHVPVICVNGAEVCRHGLDRERLLAAVGRMP